MSYVNKVSEKDMCQRKFHYVCLRILSKRENSTYYTLTPNIRFSLVKKPVTYVKDWEEPQEWLGPVSRLQKGEFCF